MTRCLNIIQLQSSILANVEIFLEVIGVIKIKYSHCSWNFSEDFLFYPFSPWCPSTRPSLLIRFFLKGNCCQLLSWAGHCLSPQLSHHSCWKESHWTREKTPCLRALVTLPENLSSILNTEMETRCHSVCQSNFREVYTLLCPLAADRYVGKTL